MKKILCFLLCALCFGTFAQQDFELQIVVDHEGENIFPTGSAIPVKITYKCPESYTLRAWNVSAYAKNVPVSFGKALELPLRGKDPKWQGYSFHNWKWIGNAQSPLKIQFTTKNWPEGDYRVSISVLFRKAGEKSHKEDKYISKLVSFSLEKE